MVHGFGADTEPEFPHAEYPRGILFYRLASHPLAEAPVWGPSSTPGVVLFAAETVTVAPREVQEVSTGLVLALPMGWSGWMTNRMATLEPPGWSLYVKPRLVEEGMRGPVRVLVENIGHREMEVFAGSPIAQLVLTVAPGDEPEVELSESEKAMQHYSDSIVSITFSIHLTLYQ